MEDSLWRRSASGLAALIASGEVTARKVVASHLDRIALVNPKVNAVTNLLTDSALDAADEVDRRRKAGEVLGPLAGVPFTIKENIDVAGSATTFGVKALCHVVPQVDAPIVERLRASGAIPIARTNLPDMSMRFHTESQLYGQTLNPWDRSRTPGGSSGGEGVAVATGMSPLGLGNDAGGSVRVPALFNGVAGLKPSYGRLPGDRSILPRDLMFASQVIPVDGIIARSVTDLSLALAVMAGPHVRDPRAVPAPLVGQRSKTPIRVAVMADPGGVVVHPDVRAGIGRAADGLGRI